MTRDTRLLYTAYRLCLRDAARAGLRCLEYLALDAQGVDPWCGDAAVLYARHAAREALTAATIRPALLSRLLGGAFTGPTVTDHCAICNVYLPGAIVGNTCGPCHVGKAVPRG